MSDEPLDPFRALLSAGSRAHYVDAAYYDQTYRLRRCDKDYYAAEAASAGPPEPAGEEAFDAYFKTTDINDLLSQTSNLSHCGSKSRNRLT